MPELAKQITVKRQGNEVELLVDGEPFPWYIGVGVDLHVDRADSPGVTLTLLADEVQVEDRQRKPPPPDVDWLLIDAESDIKVGRYSTNQRFIEGDIITRSDGALSKIEKIDIETKCWHVSPYETAALS